MSLWSPMTTSTFSTPSAMSISGPVAVVQRPVVRAFVPERDDRVDASCAWLQRRRLGIDRAAAPAAPRTGRAGPGSRSDGVSTVVKPTTPDADAVRT